MPHSKPTILFVDDDESIRNTYPLHLRSAGFEVDVAESEERAAELINLREPGCAYEVVVTDMKMSSPEGGLIVLKDVLSADLTTQVIVLTGYADLTQAVGAMRMGAFGYMAKSGEPGESAALVEHVKKAIQLRGAQLYIFRSLGPAIGDIYARLQSVADSANEALGQAKTLLDLQEMMLLQSQRKTDPH